MTMQQEAQRMTTPTSIPGATVEAVDAPPIPGLTFRHATAADWPVIADIDNRAHRADGTDEQRSAESLAADYEPRDHFRLERDIVIAEIGGEPVAYHVGYRVMRGQVMALETQGAVAPGASGPGHRDRAPAHHPDPARCRGGRRSPRRALASSGPGRSRPRPSAGR